MVGGGRRGEVQLEGGDGTLEAFSLFISPPPWSRVGLFKLLFSVFSQFVCLFVCLSAMSLSLSVSRE